MNILNVLEQFDNIKSSFLIEMTEDELNRAIAHLNQSIFKKNKMVLLDTRHFVFDRVVHGNRQYIQAEDFVKCVEALFRNNKHLSIIDKRRVKRQMYDAAITNLNTNLTVVLSFHFERDKINGMFPVTLLTAIIKDPDKRFTPKKDTVHFKARF